MTQSSTTRQTLSSSDLSKNLSIIEVKPGLKFSEGILAAMLPDIETTLFFGKVYELDAQQLGKLIGTLHRTPLVDALVNGGHAHSVDLQDYLVDIIPDVSDLNAGDVTFDNERPPAEVLPQLWAQLEVEVAQSIKDVAAKLAGVVNAMPGKQGHMVFKSMAVMNAKRPIVGDYKAKIHHARQAANLVILDVSGSVDSPTVRAIIDDVVALSYDANAHLAIVSDTCTVWEPGTFNVSSVLAAAEYSGTHYEQLAGLFSQDWGVVVCIADYDSSYGAKDALARCVGRIDTVFDVSLVNRPTFLAECVGQLASDVKPLLIANDRHSYSPIS